MKSTFPKSLFVSLVMMGALMPYAYAGEPIDGVDVKLGKNPGGSIMATVRTGPNGMVVFADLEVGKYWFELVPQTQLRTFNTTRSNIKHPGIILSNGVEEQTFSIEFVQSNDPKPLGPVQFEVTRKPGKVTVVFTRASAPAPAGGKPAEAKPAAPKKQAPK